MAGIPGARSAGVHIVKAQSHNIPHIKSMVNSAYSKYIERIGKEPAPMTADYDEMMSTHEIFVLETEPDNAVVGSIILHTNTALDSIEINNLVVDPTAQGRGYGRVLMKFAEDYAKSQGREALTLYTNVKMYENLALYPKMGFAETERKTDSGFERVYFRKNL